MSEKEYLLLIDIGNTNIKIGLGREKTLKACFVFPSNYHETADNWGLRLLELCRYAQIPVTSIACWVISSVVPPLDSVFRQAGQSYFNCPVYFVPADISLPLHNCYQLPGEVGADRLVSAYAARRLFSSQSIIVVDFGTATTFDCIQDWNYLGGLICPGVLSSAKALATRTAKLPQISLEFSTAQIQIGQNTSTSLNQGFIFGFASLVEGLCQRLKKQLSEEVQVVATGGFASSLKTVCPCLQEIIPDLLLQGLLKAYYNSLENQKL